MRIKRQIWLYLDNFKIHNHPQRLFAKQKCIMCGFNSPAQDVQFQHRLTGYLITYTLCNSCFSQIKDRDELYHYQESRNA